MEVEKFLKTFLSKGQKSFLLDCWLPFIYSSMFATVSRWFLCHDRVIHLTLALIESQLILTNYVVKSFSFKTKINLKSIK
jgi:hypothetical protein